MLKYGLRNMVRKMEKKKFEQLMRKVLEEDKVLLRRLADR